MSKVAVLTALLSLAASPFARAAEPCEPPVAVAKRLFETGYSPSSEGARRGLLAPGFERAVTAEVGCLAKEGLCSLDYDPWLGAQDGEIVGKPEFAVISETEDFSTVVQMSYRFSVGPRPATLHAVEIVLSRDAGQCWKVADLITPIGESLLHVFSTP